MAGGKVLSLELKLLKLIICKFISLVSSDIELYPSHSNDSDCIFHGVNR